MRNTIQTPEKARLSFEVPKKVQEQLRDITDRSGATSFTEVIRRALALYDLVLEHREDDGKVVLRYKDGTEETLRII